MTTIDEMTPAELNEAIAKTKGWKWYSWSGDYNAAMELVEEMRLEGADVTLYFSPDDPDIPERQLCFVENLEELYRFEKWADDMRISICCSYLKWCEARKEKE